MRAEFASFLEHLANGKATDAEWSQFVVTHYPEPFVESVRVDLVRAAIANNPRGSPDWTEPAMRGKLKSLIELLRQ